MFVLHSSLGEQIQVENYRNQQQSNNQSLFVHVFLLALPFRTMMKQGKSSPTSDGCQVKDPLSCFEFLAGIGEESHLAWEPIFGM